MVIVCLSVGGQKFKISALNWYELQVRIQACMDFYDERSCLSSDFGTVFMGIYSDQINKLLDTVSDWGNLK